MGDIGRTKRQQWFLRGLLADLKKPETIIKIPKIISVANKYVKTDMTPYEMSQYANLATHFDMDNIEDIKIAISDNEMTKRVMGERE